MTRREENAKFEWPRVWWRSDDGPREQEAERDTTQELVAIFEALERQCVP